jgi:stress response protein SCP2
LTTKDGRQFVYQYNGNEKSQEVEEDPTGRMETPIVGSIVKRHGKEWKVVHVIAPVSSRGTVPLVRVFLSDNLKGRSFFLKRSVP